MVIEFAAPRPTKSLIRDQQPNFYPTNIPIQHQQLKHYISTKDGDYMYYAANYEIYSLNLQTKKRRLVKSLKWKPCCLDAAYDWICVGGQFKGQCAFIEVKRNSNHAASSPLSFSRHAEVDDLLPLDLDPDSRALVHQGSSTLRLAPSRSPRYTLHEYEIGDDIVNSVVVQCLPSGREGLEDQIVAVLTNNDKTVRVFSLTKLDMLESPGEYPTAMNHASISPCGNLLIAVGDKPQAFFSQRIFTQRFQKGRLFWEWEWQGISEPKLSLAHEKDCCFATAFSPSGHICAAASQTGAITVFDTSRIGEDMYADDAVIAILRSSRPNLSNYRGNDRGAIRSISFSPAPWDLLVVAEEKGRVHAIDLRNALQSTQALFLEPESPKVNRLEILDHETTFEQRQLEIERRFLESHNAAQAAQDHLAAVTNTADYMEYAVERRRRENMNINLTAYRSDPHRLTESERLTIDTFRQSRLPVANVDPPTAMSVDHSISSNRFMFLPPSPPWNVANPSDDPNRRTASIAEYTRLRDTERSRHSNERYYQPRRRSSIVISNSNVNTSTSPHPSSLTPIGVGTSGTSTPPSHLPTTPITGPTLDFVEEPWQTISAAMSTTNEASARIRRIDSRNSSERPVQTGGGDRSSHDQRLQTLQLLASRNEQQRQLALLNSQRLNMMRAQSRRAEIDNEEDVTGGELISRPDEGREVTTMGVGWSPDGRNLYIATEVGIFEYKVNTDLRKQFPGMSWV